MYKQRYLIDNAIIDAARAAYLATLIEKGVTEVERYSNNPADIKDLFIRTFADQQTEQVEKQSTGSLLLLGKDE